MNKASIPQGTRYGKLTVIDEIVGTKSSRKFLTLCDCGNTSKSFLSNMKRGHTVSCGCMSSRNFMSEASKTHGMSTSKEYKSWQEMLSRCLNSEHRYYEKYSNLEGGVQECWKTSFQDFHKYIGNHPEGKGIRWSVGRIDNDVGYTEGNVRWEDSFQQNRNRGKSKANTSGTTGVRWAEAGKRPHGRAIARWYDLSGKLKSRSFSEKYIGKDDAMQLAINYRSKMIDDLNKQGAGYSDKHGK
jgi:hypothetical protein